MKQLLDQFICVRLVKANNLDLTRFQFDYDLTFAVLFMNQNGTVYGRYGTRSSVKDADKDMTTDGLAASMKLALALHGKHAPAIDRATTPLPLALHGKQPRPTKYRRPDDFPSLRGKFKSELNYKGSVSRSCMHCHQVRDAERQVYRDAGQPIPDRVLFAYPAPKVLGLQLDARSPALIARVVSGSAAQKAGLRTGDTIKSIDGQSIISQADVQWALHHTADAATLSIVIDRQGEQLRRPLKLEKGWRGGTDISWRVTSWSLRRMGTGGILFEPATAKQRRRAGVGENELALHAKHVGQYGAHAAAKRAGFRKGDIVIAFDGQKQHMTTSQLLAYTVQKTKPGDRLDVVVFRGGKRLKLRLPMQK